MEKLNGALDLLHSLSRQELQREAALLDVRHEQRTDVERDERDEAAEAEESAAVDATLAALDGAADLERDLNAAKRARSCEIMHELGEENEKLAAENSLLREEVEILRGQLSRSRERLESLRSQPWAPWGCE